MYLLFTSGQLFEFYSNITPVLQQYIYGNTVKAYSKNTNILENWCTINRNAMLPTLASDTSLMNAF